MWIQKRIRIINCLTNNILYDEVPANNEGDKFSHRDVAVDVSGTSFRYSSAKLRIAEACQNRLYMTQILRKLN